LSKPPLFVDLSADNWYNFNPVNALRRRIMLEDLKKRLEEIQTTLANLRRYL